MRLGWMEQLDCDTCYGDGLLIGEDENDEITCPDCNGTGIREHLTYFYDTMKEMDDNGKDYQNKF